MDRSFMSMCKLRHEIAMDTAVFMYKLTAPEAAAAWIKVHIDHDDADAMSRKMGSESYDRYLLDLHKRCVGR